MEGGQISGKETNHNKEKRIQEMFPLRAGLNLEISTLSRISSSRLEKERQEEIREKSLEETVCEVL